MFEGLLTLPLWGYVVVTLVLTHITIVAVTVFLHRHQAHRALDLHPLVSHFFRFWLWLTTGMVTQEWVAIHRKHHIKCETEEDPHSPQIMGIRKVLLDGVDLYRKEAANSETLERYGKGTPNDWLEQHVYSSKNVLGLTLSALLQILLFGPIGLTMWAVQMLWIPFWAAGVINGLGHWWGYRNYATPDASTNLSPWGIVIGGEELHNNHHAYPGSAKLSAKWWEFDIGWFYIRLLATVGLAKVKNVAVDAVVVAGKTQVDAETLSAVIANRFQLTARYTKLVILPVLKEEMRKADASCQKLLKRAKGLLVKDESLFDRAAWLRLDRALDRCQQLKVVYQYRQRLQDIWKRSTASQESLLKALQEWCRQAEDTGITALQDFAHNLPGYARRTPA